MATRFLAVVPKDGASASDFAQQVAQCTDLECAYRAERLIIFTDAGADYAPLSDEIGLVIGPLFLRGDHPTRVKSFSTWESRQTQVTVGENLLKRFWGGYVAIIADSAGRGAHILRDPSDAMPCYYLDHRDATIIGSDVETLLEAELFEPELNWSLIPQQLLALDLRSEATALVGIKELLPGFSLSIDGASQTLRQRWSPWDHVEPVSNLSDAELSACLRETVTGCVRAWGSCFEDILLGVSGGLDSSIVAAALANGRSDLTCFTLSTDEGEGDERHYARILTESLGLPLVEAFYQLDQIDVRKSIAAHLPRPFGMAAAQGYFHTQLGIGRELGSGAYFNGNGGDNVFCLMQSATPILDRLKSEGFGRGAWRTLQDVCELTNCSIWDAAKLATRRAIAGGIAYRWKTDGQFLSSSAIESIVTEPSHPWLAAPLDGMLGKAVHIAMLVRIQGASDGYSRRGNSQQVYPLLSQPIVELCLSIPTWSWCAGGRNRSLARSAFADAIPTSLINRRSKGGPGSFSYEVFNSNREVLREILREGILARHGILDLPSVDLAFASRRQSQYAQYRRLSILADAEAWLASWESRKAARSVGRTKGICARGTELNS
jgi:asparagine synthase (glutamine-hydrolysing)